MEKYSFQGVSKTVFAWNLFTHRPLTTAFVTFFIDATNVEANNAREIF